MGVRRGPSASSSSDDLPKFKDVGIREASQDDWRSLVRGDRHAGAGAKPRALTKVLLDQQKASAVAQRDLPRRPQPHWAKRLVAAKAAPEEMLKAAIERAAKTPDEATLREVEAVINELGRDEKRVSTFGRLVTPTVIRTTMKKKG